MGKYNVTGMSCAACSAAVEKAVKKVNGVQKCTVSLLTNSMTVDGQYDEEELVSAVKKAGYNAFSAEDVLNAPPQKEDGGDIKALKSRLIWSLAFLVLLMYTAMGHNMLSFPLPNVLESSPVSIALVQLILSGIVLVINQKFFINGFKSLAHGSPNMDTLVALGSSVSFIYSIGVTFVMINSPVEAPKLLHGLYYESAAMILALITVGKLLEAISKGRTTDALKGLMALAPKSATVIRGGKEYNIPIEQVRKDDIFTVRPGESIPVDGVVIDGKSSVDESSLTGESMPVDKETDNSVYSGTINLSGFMKCRATSVGEDTALSKIIETVRDAAATKAPIARVADKVSGVFVPAVIAIAVITTAIWLLLGKDIGFALVRGISVLVISCPCALGLATPVAIMVGNGLGAKNGILFKSAEVLENAGRVSAIALDKTGTVTKGAPFITDIIPVEISEEELIKYAYSLEVKSEHPLGKAVCGYAEEKGYFPYEVTDFEAVAGNGLTAKLMGKTLCGGNKKYIENISELSEGFTNVALSLAEEGKTPLYFAYDGKIIGVIAVADVIKSDSSQAVAELKRMGIQTVMLTGDNEKTAAAIGKQAGVDKVIAGVLPEEKARVITELKKNGKVAMVGDGINDAPALTAADVGIAIGKGTDIAIDSAGIVLMKSTLWDVVTAIKISRATLRTIHQNLFWAFVYNAVGIPVAAGVFISLFGWKLTPMLGAMAMSLSSFCVVTNALRLNLANVGGTSVQATETALNEGVTLYIKGMMCGHCEKKVEEVLMAVDGVTYVKADHQKGTATVKCTDESNLDEMKRVVEAEDYKVKRIVK